MLLCTVRTCHLPLARQERRFVCARGHSFDVARSGYVNLLQPNERRSRAPGDSAEAIAARRRIAELSGGQALLPVLSARSVLDVGCGDGYWLASVDAEDRVGIDISVAAISAAAKNDPDCFWIVANADRFIPFSDGSFDVVMSVTARLNPGEFHRVLRDDGRLLVAVPGPDDLIELRGRSGERDRVERTVALFAGQFMLVETRRVSTKVMLDEVGIRDVLRSAYRFSGSGSGSGSGAGSRTVTFSRDLLLFAPGSRGTPGGSSL